jgi:hypothetical protein
MEAKFSLKRLVSVTFQCLDSFVLTNPDDPGWRLCWGVGALLRHLFKKQKYRILIFSLISNISEVEM